ncbi:PREDICTED: NADH dehydrogenase [ubiquinone] 1 beta subcomplex subunit 3 [Nicrophorus vespilloides]|uniref:NADH dehydrogenase [ubiquinone] 1 beta subcomplex subunit 3 n=1 Tax=Nicrophorus vespilloides TaxID=110193 RepID=A0ABM1N5W9_NICVS|nr:PREDICTED: NADH dehydrogenase [ubiquinone] 1 beta subcomplex subunit 3 [Nicrophorus vespilloides]
MGHGHGHGDPYKIPDYRIYKVEDVPILMQTQRALQSQGLKDPWLRNEVWRYNEKEFGTFSSRVKMTFFRGFKYGFGAFLVTIAGTALYDKMFPSKHDHGHH